MKRFFALLLLTVVLSGCDDGDLTQVSFEFDASVASACNTNTGDFFIYKTEDKRALIIQLPESNFRNIVSTDAVPQPTPLQINGTSIRLVYREYSGEVTNNTICSAVPAANPFVVQEREATEGKIMILTTAIKSEPDANGATRITAYLHTLTFSDLKFDLGDGNSQINEAFNQVTYQTSATPLNNFSGLPGIFSCTGNQTFLYKFNPTQALLLNLNVADAAFLFSGEAGIKTRLLSATNTLRHVFYNTTNASLSEPFFCTNPSPATPPVIDSFVSSNGVENQTGIIEVTSLTSDNGFKHTIVLKKVRLNKGSLNVQLGDSFIFGEFETPN